MERLKSILKWFLKDKKRLLILVVFGTVIFFVARRGQTSKLSYQTAKVEKGTIISSVSASGQILSTSFVNINTQATGIVSKVYVKNGEKVFAGQSVAKISLDADGAFKNTQAWASAVSARNALNAANNNYRGTQASLEYIYDQLKGHDADETFAQKEIRTKFEVANDNAYDQTKSASANLASANMSYRLSSPVVVAPISGIIDNITITPGMILSGSSSSSATTPNRVAVVRIKGSPMASFNLSEVDVNRVMPGQKATITLDSISGKTFTGRVLTVDKIGTVTGGVTNYPVVISFDTQTTAEILPNMAATANIIITTKNNVLLIPSAAIQTQDEESYVRVLRNNVVEDIPVEAGLSSDTQTEIISGLKEGDEVITGVAGGTPRQGSASPFNTFRLGGGSGFRVGGAR